MIPLVLTSSYIHSWYARIFHTNSFAITLHVCSSLVSNPKVLRPRSIPLQYSLLSHTRLYVQQFIPSSLISCVLRDIYTNLHNDLDETSKIGLATVKMRSIFSSHMRSILYGNIPHDNPLRCNVLIVYGKLAHSPYLLIIGDGVANIYANPWL